MLVLNKIKESKSESELRDIGTYSGAEKRATSWSRDRELEARNREREKRVAGDKKREGNKNRGGTEPESNCGAVGEESEGSRRGCKTPKHHERRPFNSCSTCGRPSAVSFSVSELD